MIFKIILKIQSGNKKDPAHPQTLEIVEKVFQDFRLCGINVDAQVLPLDSFSAPFALGISMIFEDFGPEPQGFLPF